MTGVTHGRFALRRGAFSSPTNVAFVGERDGVAAAQRNQVLQESGVLPDGRRRVVRRATGRSREAHRAFRRHNAKDFRHGNGLELFVVLLIWLFLGWLYVGQS